MSEAHLALFAFFVPFDRRGRMADGGASPTWGNGFPKKNHAKLLGK